MDAPAIAKDYWRLKPDAKLIDVIYAVRSDESTHRYVHFVLIQNTRKRTTSLQVREPHFGQLERQEGC